MSEGEAQLSYVNGRGTYVKYCNCEYVGRVHHGACVDLFNVFSVSDVVQACLCDKIYNFNVVTGMGTVCDVTRWWIVRCDDGTRMFWFIATISLCCFTGRSFVFACR